MKFLSVCSGIEAASVAWNPLGWKAAAFAEIGKFPSKLLAHHYPSTPNYGDMTQYKDWPDESIDLLCGGTPCQSFSVAGLREGLSDPRGDLMLTFGAIAAKYRPRWLVWENVPGVLSSSGGRDFGVFLGMLAKLGYGFAYRVLDAQYIGVPQRRRRVFVVGCLGDWRSAAAVLFERHSLSGNLAPSRKAGESVAPTITSGAPFSKSGNDRVETEALVTSLGSGKQVIGTLMANCGQKQWLGNQEAFTGDFHVISYDRQQITSKENRSRVDLNQPAPTITKSSEIHVAYALAGNTIGRASEHGGNGLGCDDSGAMYTLTATDRHAVAFSAKDDGRGAALEVSPTIQHQHTGIAFAKGMQVRRLTPKEWERCQGFPDEYTNIPGAKDSNRYEALGNSWAAPVARWIGERIDQVEAIHQSTRMAT